MVASGVIPGASTMNNNTIIAIVNDNTLTIKFNNAVETTYGDRQSLLSSIESIFHVLADKNQFMQFILISTDDKSKRFYNYNNSYNEQHIYKTMPNGRVKDMYIKGKDLKKYKLKFIPDEMVTFQCDRKKQLDKRINELLQMARLGQINIDELAYQIDVANIRHRR